MDAGFEYEMSLGRVRGGRLTDFFLGGGELQTHWKQVYDGEEHAEWKDTSYLLCIQEGCMEAELRTWR